jgi:hypothetical protein
MSKDQNKDVSMIINKTFSIFLIIKKFVDKISEKYCLILQEVIYNTTLIISDTQISSMYYLTPNERSLSETINVLPLNSLINNYSQLQIKKETYYD